MRNYAPSMHPLHALVRAAEDCGTIDGSPVVCSDFGDSSTGPPGWFVGAFVLMIVVAVGTTIYKMSVAHDIATKSGMDPGDAANMALLDEHGLAATYVLSNLKQPAAETPEAEAPTTDGARRTVEQRLAELDSLRAKGVVTQAEYDERRTAILESL